MRPSGRTGLRAGLFLLCLGPTVGLAADTSRLRLATTTSTDNSGLLSVLIPVFEKSEGVRLDVIAVGTGRALLLGRNGDVDLLMVHAPQAEAEFVDQGYGVARLTFMINDFVLLGPPRDPAQVLQLTINAALGRIAESESSYVSRGDDSGTHKKELGLWREAGVAPQGRWYKEVGQGMGATIMITDNLRGYTLADRGTYLALKDKIVLKIIVQGDPELLNPYSVIAVNPARQPHVRYREAQAFINWIASPAAQTMIGEFMVDGEPLFRPLLLPDLP